MAQEKYTNKEDVKAHAGDVGDATDAQIDAWISAMSGYIDDYCKTIIYTDTAATHKYDGDGTESLMIDACRSITSIMVGDNEKLSDIYQYPANKDYTFRLELDGDTFRKGKQNIEVSGKFSRYDEVPEDIKYVCEVLVTGIINNKRYEGVRGISKDMGDFRLSFTNDAGKADLDTAMDILKKYRRIAI